MVRGVTSEALDYLPLYQSTLIKEAERFLKTLTSWYSLILCLILETVISMMAVFTTMELYLTVNVIFDSCHTIDNFSHTVVSCMTVRLPPQPLNTALWLAEPAWFACAIEQCCPEWAALVFTHLAQKVHSKPFSNTFKWTSSPVCLLTTPHVEMMLTSVWLWSLLGQMLLTGCWCHSKQFVGCVINYIIAVGLGIKCERINAALYCG